MAKSKIQLKREASDLKNQAHQKLEDLKEAIVAQRDEDFDGTRLTSDEISERREEIQSLVNEAKSLEDLNDLDGLMNRPDDEKSDGAKKIENAYRKYGDKGADEGKSTVGSRGLNYFLRAVRTRSGEYENPVDMGKKERAELTTLRRLATDFERGEPMKEISLGDLDVKILVGDDDTSSGRGDYLVPPEFLSELLQAMGEEQQFVNRARRVPMARPQVKFPRLGQTDADTDRPFFSFGAAVTVGEGGEKPEREPTFEQLTLNAYKYAAYTEASDELLVDSIVDLPPVLSGLLTRSIAYEYDRDGIRGAGDGSDRPQGYLGSAAEYEVARATASEIALEDVFEMEARHFGEGLYLFHPSDIPQLYGLTKDNIIVWHGDASASTPGTLLGRSMVRTHKLPSLGTKGDLSLVDPSFYLVGDLQRISIMNSIHYRFRNDITAWRAVFRGGGTPWPAGTFSHEASGSTKTYEVSPFVVLGDPEGS